MKPEIISSKKIYNGKIFDVTLDRIREGEIEYEREIVSHNGSAVIVPVYADDFKHQPVCVYADFQSCLSAARPDEEA